MENTEVFYRHRLVRTTKHLCCSIVCSFEACAGALGPLCSGIDIAADRKWVGGGCRRWCPAGAPLASLHPRPIKRAGPKLQPTNKPIDAFNQNKVTTTTLVQSWTPSSSAYNPVKCLHLSFPCTP